MSVPVSGYACQEEKERMCVCGYAREEERERVCVCADESPKFLSRVKFEPDNDNCYFFS